MSLRLEDSADQIEARLAEFERENAKLRKINEVLMRRVERSMDLQGSEFSLFETAILLEGRVRERTAALEKALEELRRSSAMLEEAKAAADRANASKTQFFAAASHDLLQPLNAMRLFISALAETEQSACKRGYIENIEIAFGSVERLLEALLDISKLDAGVLVPEIADIPIGALLKSLAAEFQPLAEVRGLALRVVGSRATVRTDPDLLVRVLSNLLSNAIRYTRRGKVLLGCRRVNGAIRIEVLDTGIGIPEDKLGEIFEEFRRLGSDRNARDRGFGLGLAIVQRIARMLGHKLTVTSALGKGSRFAITVPLGHSLRARRKVPLKAEPVQHGLGGARVFVIENEANIQTGMRSLLEGWGCHVSTAATAQALLEDIAEAAPDLIIADYYLDDGALGTDAIAAIRDRSARPVPALVITADRTPMVQEALQRLGIPVLNKPVPPAKLRSLMSHLIASPVVKGRGGV